MPDKALVYAQMAEETAKQITGSYQRWTAFLTTAARVYKYPYTEQLLIYAQRPDATACAEYGLWTNTMRRYVRRGSKGIALIDTSGETPRIRYVFDISDTGGREDSRRLNPWSLNDDNMDAVLDFLHNQYEINAASMPDLLETIATQLSTQYWEENQRDILDIVDGSFLEEYDEYNVGAAFRQAASVSITYMLMSRCGLEPENHFGHEDFMSIFDFNTPETVAALGTAVSQISQTVLRQIEVTIRNAERRMEYERNDEQPDIPASRGHTAAQRDPGRDGNGAAPGQVRQDEEKVSQGTAPGAVQQPDRNGEIAEASAGDRGDSPAPSGSDDGRNEGKSGPDRADESRESNAVGGPDERPESPGRGNPDERADLQLTDTQSEEPAQETTEQPIAESAEENEPSALSNSDQKNTPEEPLREESEQAVFNFPEMSTEQTSFFSGADSPAQPVDAAPLPHGLRYPQEIIDAALTIGANDRSSRKYITAYFMKDKSDTENAFFLRDHYKTNGAGFYVRDQQYAIWYDASGIRLSAGTTAQRDSAYLIPWEQAAQRIRELLDEGRYIPSSELKDVSRLELAELAESLLHLYGDLDSEYRGMHLMPTVGNVYNTHGGYPEMTAQVAELLRQPASLHNLEEEMMAFLNAYAENRDILRLHYHRPRRFLTSIADLQRKPLTFTAAPDYDPQRRFFISDDEIDHLLQGSVNDHEYRLGVYAFFLANAESKAREAYMKRVHGEHSGFYGGNDNIEYTHKGISFSHGSIGNPYAGINWTWNQAVRRIGQLIQTGRFLTDEDRAAIPEYERKQVARQIVSAFSDAPDYIPRPFTGNAITDYWENVQQVQEQMTDPERVKAIHASLLSLSEMTLPNDRLYAIRNQALETVEAYQEGKYSLFGEKREPLLVSSPEQAVKDEQEAPMAAVEQENQEQPAFSTEEPSSLSPAAQEESRQETPLQAVSSSASSPRTIAQADIDEALREWNGSTDSKRAVMEYMREHGRERDAAAWLRQEYGDDLPAYPVHGVVGAEGDISWTRVQRSILRLIQEDRFFTEEEKLENLSPEANREAPGETEEPEISVPSSEAAETPSPTEYVTPGGIHYHVGDTFQYTRPGGSATSILLESIDENGDFVLSSDRFSDGERIAVLRSAVEEYLDNGKYILNGGKEAEEAFHTPGGHTYRAGDELDWVVDGDLHISIRIDRVDAENVWCTFPGSEDAESTRMERKGFEAQIDSGSFVFAVPAQEQVQEEAPAPDIDSSETVETIEQKDTAPFSAEETVSLPLSQEAAAEYNDLKARYPDALIGFEQHGYYEFYGDDAEKAARILNAKTLVKNIPGGQVQVTGFPADRWQSNFRKLWQTGSDVYLAGENPDGTHEETKYLRGQDYLPLHASVHIDQRKYEIVQVNYEQETVMLRDIDSVLDARFPSIREEKTEFVRSWLEEEPDYPPMEEIQPDAAEPETKNATPAPQESEPSIPDSGIPETKTEQDNIQSPPRMMETIVELTENGYQVTETRPVREYQYDCMYHDIAYLDGQAYQVEKIGLFDVTFQPLEMENPYPVSRVESRERLETLLAQDERNSHLRGTATLEQRQQAQAEWRERENHSEPTVTNIAPVSSEPVQQEMPKAQNFRITDNHLGEGGAKTKFKNNMAAIYTLKILENEGRPATPEEQEVLSRYVGWGGLANAFDPDKREWTGEYRELEAALNPEEYAAARASTLNAHYTSPTVIRAIYDALGNMGFQKGNILEPSMGVGNFFGMLPESMRESRLYGVELDSITGRIAQKLYPQADITVAGFETTDRRDFFDVAVGNVPFGNYKVNDWAYNKLGFNIHNYFFAKALDQVRPGGIVAFVTSKYTMDAKSPEVRKYLAERAELLGAIRLPSNAFTANAGTEVTTDIIFLQKRDSPMVTEPDWVHLGESADGVPVNSYFVDHPEMVLGTMTFDDKMYGYERETTCEPIPGAELTQQLSEAITHIQGQYQEAELPDLAEGEEIIDSLPADPDVANFSYTVVDGKVYYREDSIMVRPKLSQTAQERTAGMVELRDCVHQLMAAQLNDAPDQEIQSLQARLNTLYDAYTVKYGLINSRGNAQAFSADSSYYLLCSLEVLDENGDLERKADMFTKRTIRQQRVVDHVDTAVEALALSISERAKVDLPYMAHLTDKTEEEIISDLQGVIFRLPEPAGKDGRSKYVTADEYLSGNVRQKLQRARSWAESDDSFQVNVKALEAVQPKDLSASEIDVRLGATWIDKKYIRQFMYEAFHTPVYKMWNDLPYASNRHAITVNYSPVSAEWNISNKSEVSYNDVTANTTFGTSRVNAYEILEAILNLRDMRIFDTVKDAEGKEKRKLNQKETTLAQQKQQAIKDAFRDWIWKDPDRREELVHVYNEKFNSTRPREYDGSHISFAGMNPEIELRPHQRNAIAHILYGGNTLLAHQVGAGKTFEMAAAIMESKRLGLCNKAILVVPNHLTEQWSSEFLRLYPTAKLLVTTKKDFEKKNRKKFCARIATGDYDAVIIGHSQFEKIPISYDRQEQMLQEQIDQIVEGIEELKYERGERFSIKQMERTKKGLEARLVKLRADHKKDDVVTFEQLGVDRLYVDESHSFKNLFVYTKMSNVAGLSTAEAQKSNDMFLKCRYMDEITGGKGIVFATGTPISNSMVEMYTIQRYLQYETLKQQNMTHFDCWASTFGETVTALELAPEGTGYRARTRFAKFFNLPELMNMFKEVADVKTADQLNLPTPEAHYETIAVKPSEIQKSLIQSLSERAAAVHARLVDPTEDNMLKIVRC